ncbi:HIT family protein [Geovibrio thiophilus]|uniref:HIT family protein n=1 Tax=Geovibrio thiophilus TaxID=139438 RepID=A0A410K202_9BACT|nr:HIT family protein [Geovibrio thiophilus]QAR34393.1 HIT family protein [Geovibrio thiophilus]
METIFTKIINGEIPAAKVYEDDDFLAILDIRPVNFGHTLLIPKKYFVNVFDAPLDVAAKIYPVLTKIANGMKNALNCDGVNIYQNNGAAAGQEVFHAHLHIVPRYEGDEMRFAVKHVSYENPAAMQEFAAKIAKEIK